MRKVFFALVFGLFLFSALLMLRSANHTWKNNVKVFDELFSGSLSCVSVADSVLKKHAELLPTQTAQDSLQAAFLAKLLDGVGYIDDFGIDKKKIEDLGDFKVLSLYSAKKNGFLLKIKFTQRENCLEILHVVGLYNIFSDPCLSKQ